MDAILELVHPPGVLEQVLRDLGLLHDIRVLLHGEWQREGSGLQLTRLEAEAGAIEGLVHEVILLELLVAPESEVHLLDFPRLDRLRVLLHGVPLGLILQVSSPPRTFDQLAYLGVVDALELLLVPCHEGAQQMRTSRSGLLDWISVVSDEMLIPADNVDAVQNAHVNGAASHMEHVVRLLMVQMPNFTRNDHAVIQEARTTFSII